MNTNNIAARYREVINEQLPRDPKDDHVLEVAVASKTKMIITHSIKNFKGAEKFGIRTIPPGKLLEITR